MAGASGIFGQVTTGVETVYGTSVARDRGIEITGEQMDYNPTRKSAMGIHAGGMVALASQQQTVAVSGAGSVTCYVPTKQFGRLLLHTLGSVATTTLSGTPTNGFQHVFTLAELQGKSLTIQKGMPRRDNTVVPYTFTGAKMTSMQLSLQAQDFLTTTMNWDFQDMQTAPALDTPTYPSGRAAFSYVNATILIDGSAYSGITGWDLTIDNKPKVDDYFIGGGGKKNEPVRNDWLGLTGNLSGAFFDSTLLNKFITNSSAALILTITAGQINTVPTVETFKVELPAIRFTGNMPNLQGAAAPTLSMPYEVLDDGTNPPVKITYISTDATS
jgi:hypothetical protein